MQHYQNFVCYNPTTNKTRTHDTVQWFPHDELFPFMPGIATTTNLLLTKLINTLDKSTQKPTDVSNVPALIRYMHNLLHKNRMLPSVKPTPKIDSSSIPRVQLHTQPPASTSKGTKQQTIEHLQQITDQFRRTSGDLCSTPTSTSPPSSVPRNQKQTKLWDIISKGGTEQTK